MYILIYMFIIFLLFTNVKSLLRLYKSNKFLKNNKKYNKIFTKKVSNKIKVIIPVYNEINTVSKSIEYFSKFSDICDVIYVTTSKEKNMGTYKKILECVKKYKTENITVVNSPNTYGTMANQLNFACSKMHKDDIIAIYNVDSFPEKKTFIYVLDNINDNEVFQQVSYFDDSNKNILKSAQNWQNRWSLVYEMGKYLSNKKIEFKYTIGHGLFLKKNILDKYGYWSENEINEDNEFGYRLLINSISIKPIPFMEQANFANTIKIYVKQQSTWVNGPLYAFSYYKKNKHNIKNLTLTFLNFKAFLSWWLFPLITLIFIIMSTFLKFYLLTILLLIINYISVINYLSYVILKKNGYLKQKYTFNVILDIVFFFVHSIGSYITLYKLITHKNTIKNKYNTEK